jgi:hypothetical protein
MKKFISNVARIYSFSEISSSFNENTEDIVDFFTETFGSGLVSFFDPSPYFIGEKITDGPNTFYTIRIDESKELKFLDGLGISKISDSLVRHSIIFDDLNVLNGSSENPIEFKKTFRYINSSLRSSNHSFEDILAVYVNGTPLYNSEFLVENNGGIRRLIIRKVRFGKIFPLPKDKNGSFFKELIEDEGVSKSDLVSKLMDENGYIVLEFPFLKTKITDKELVLELITSARNRAYYNIPKNFPKYKNGAFYKDDEYIPGVIKISLGNIESLIASSDKVRFFFVSKAIKRNSSPFVKKYSVGVSNLSEETGSTKEIFVLDERSGEFLKINEALYSSPSDVIVFNYTTGEFDLLDYVLPYSHAPVYFGDISYRPPLRVFRDLDYVNNVSILGHWGFTWKGTLTSPKQIYIKNDLIPTNALTVYDNQNNLVSLISSKSAQSKISGDNQGILLGTIDPSNGSITIDSQIKTPFDRLRNLYLSSEITNPIAYSLHNMIFTNDGTVLLPIAVLTRGQVLRLYGSEFILRATNNSNSTTVPPPDISIVVLYETTQQVLAIYQSAEIAQTQMDGKNVYKNVDFNSPTLYTHNSSVPGIVYLKFSISNTTLEIFLANIYAFIA